MHIGVCNSSKSVNYIEYRTVNEFNDDAAANPDEHVLPSIPLRSINLSRRISEIFSWPISRDIVARSRFLKLINNLVSGCITHECAETISQCSLNALSEFSHFELRVARERLVA